MVRAFARHVLCWDIGKSLPIGPMNFLGFEDSAKKLLNFASNQCLRPYACICRKISNFRLKLGDVVSMNDAGVLISCQIVDDEGRHMRQVFMDKDLTQCECRLEDRRTEVRAVLSDPQWKHVMAENGECIMLGARVDDFHLFANHPDAAVVAIRHDQEVPEDVPLSMGELFSGGFSGWTHAATALAKFGINVNHDWALDRDPVACHAYNMTHQPDVHVQGPTEAAKACDEDRIGGKLPSMLFQTSIQSLWWMTFASLFMSEIVSMSAPCPAWSLADSAPGLLRADGMLIIYALFYAAILRPRILVSENVANLKAHKHWRLISWIIEWLNYKVHWNQSLDLREVIPQARDRVIMICVDALDIGISRVNPVRWPTTRKHTLRTYEVVCDLDEEWQKRAKLDDEELKLYLDPANLPKEFTRGHAKKTSRDVLAYRLKDLDSIAACILTSYGRPTALSDTLVRRGGIYGSLLMQGPVVRKMVAPEFAILMGLIYRQWIPEPEFQSTMIFGNAIAVPHALIGILNAIALIRDPWVIRGVPEIFAAVFHESMNASNICIRHEAGGFCIMRKELDDSQIPATIPMFEFAKVTVKSPMHSFMLSLEVGVNIGEAISRLTAESVPARLEVVIQNAGDVKFPLPPSLCMTAQCIDIWANVPSCLLLTEQGVKKADWPFILALHPDGILVLHRVGDALVVDVSAAIHQFSDAWVQASTDFMGRKLQDEEKCPNVMLLCDPMRVHDFRDRILVLPVFQMLAEAFHASIKVRDIQAFIHWIEKTGIHSVVRALGWHFLVQLSIDPEDMPKDVILAPKYGRLAVPPQASAQIIITRIFLNQIALTIERPVSENTVCVSIKLWESWIWERELDENITTQFIHDAWNIAHQFFGNSTPCRLIAFGRQLNPEWQIKHYDQRDQLGRRILKIHVILQLQGGGPPIPPPPPARSSLPDTFRFSELCDLEDRDPSRLVSVLLQNLMEMHDANSRMDLGYLRNAAFMSDSIGYSMVSSIPIVVRFLRDLNMTGIETMLQALGWHAVMHFEDCTEPPSVKLMIIPRAGVKHLSFDTVRSFLAHAIAAKAMPYPRMSTDGVCVRVKLCDSWVVDAVYHAQTLLGDFAESWYRVTSLFGEPSHMRLVCQNRSANPDRTLEDYVSTDENGIKFIKIFLVLQLRGGGPKNAQGQPAVKHKNALAKHLLEVGCTLEDISIFADKLISTAGIPAIANCMKSNDFATRSSNIDKLAATMKLSVPPSKPIEANIRKNTTKRINSSGLKQEHVSASNFILQEGFFFCEDGSEAKLCDNIKHGSCGVALVDPVDAAPWIRQTVSITQDELALLVLGACPTQGPECVRLDVPALTEHQAPVLLSCCLHQLGRKKVEFRRPSDITVSVEESCVVAITVFRDEVEAEFWDALIQAPVRSVFDVIKNMSVQLETKSSPWGRTWRDQNGKCSATVATSLQFHIRIASSKVVDVLNISGHRGIYAAVKTEEKKADPQFAVLWLDLPLSELKVVAASDKKSLGLVRISRGTGAKTSRGIRFRTGDLQEAAKVLKPSAAAPVTVQIKFTAKLAPTPLGATYDTIKALIESKKWQARPIKPLGAQAWLLGFAEKSKENWISWNEKMLLLSWDNEMKQKNVQAVLAGQQNLKVTAKQQVRTNDEDPWANYIKKNGVTSMGGSNATAANQVVRACEGPIEERFKEQDAKISELHSTMVDMSRRLESAEESRSEFKKQVDTQFLEVQGQVKHQVDSLSKHFDATLERAMRRQDTQLENSFSELKALILNKPLPAKKARTEKPKKPDDDEQEGDGL